MTLSLFNELKRRFGLKNTKKFLQIYSFCLNWMSTRYNEPEFLDMSITIDSLKSEIDDEINIDNFLKEKKQ